MNNSKNENSELDEIKEFYKTHLTRIEELASRLFKRKFKSAKDLWDIQIDLVNYQIELREEIRKEETLKKETNKKISEAASKKNGDWKASIKEYQNELKKMDARIYELGSEEKVML